MEKLLVIAGLGQKLYGRLLFQRVASAVIMAMGLTIMASIMVSAMLIGIFYAVYLALLYHGIGQMMAMLIISALVMVLTTLLIVLIRTCLRNLRQMPRTLLKQSPLASRAMDALNAFSDGLMAD